MNKSFLENNLIMIMINNTLIKLPTPMNISILWNFGSLLGMFLIIQILTGIFLSMHYVSNINYSFISIIHIMKDVNYGWLMRLIHMNGASFFFICVYFHIGRGMYYGSYKLTYTWLIGVIILLLMMSTAFMGYVLPWGQMSFWGATVITNLLSVIPYMGQEIVEWIWGGFSVSNATLNRFYSFHFLLPFILIVMILIHLMFLHESGSNNPLGLMSNYYKIKFHNYYTWKDLMGFILMMYFLMYIILEMPYILGDSENFLMSNPMMTPMHIQPEWYFLFAYSILRSIPNKLMGVMMLLSSIFILMFMPLLNMKIKFQSLIFYPLNQMYYWFFIFNFFLLTWLGGQPVDIPFIKISQIMTFLYFMYFYMDIVLKELWNKLIYFNI